MLSTGEEVHLPKIREICELPQTQNLDSKEEKMRRWVFTSAQPADEVRPALRDKERCHHP
jgi:hypothetical protein